MNMNIKTKLTYGIGLLFVLITLLGGLAIKNIHNVSDDTQNILADNYNSLLYSRQMLESLDAIRENPNARKEFEAGLEAQKKNLTEKDEDVLTNRTVKRRWMTWMMNRFGRYARRFIPLWQSICLPFMKRMKWLSIRRKGLSFGSGR